MGSTEKTGSSHFELLLDAAHEIADLLVGERVGERQHRDLVTHFGERALRLGADALGRRIGRRELGMRGLDRLQLAHQLVVFDVGDRRLVEHVIAVVGLVDARAQLGGACGKIGWSGGFLRHRAGKRHRACRRFRDSWVDRPSLPACRRAA